MAKLKIRRNERGFAVAEFTDLYKAACSIQESSLATTKAIWLGVDEKRMHLTQDMAKELIPLLKQFVKTGQLASET